MTNRLQIGNNLVNLLKDGSGMALVSEAYPSIGSLFRRLTCIRNIFIFFEAHADEVAAECLGNIKTGPNITQAIRPIISVQRNLGIGCHH